MQIGHPRLGWLGRRVLRLLVRTFVEYGQDNCAHLAAGIAYYVLFSLVPLVIFVVGVTGLVLQDAQLQHDLIKAILNNVPLSAGQGRNIVTSAVDSISGAQGGIIGVIGLVVTAWSASSMFGAVRRSLNVAFDLEHQRPLVRQKLVDLGMVFAVAPFFLISILATGLISIGLSLVRGVPIIGDFLGAYPAIFVAIGVSLSVGVSFVAFFFLYWIVPATHVSRTAAAVGAAIAAILFEGAKLAFSLYVGHVSSLGVVSGTVGAVLAFMLWINLSANILLIGAEAAAEVPGVFSADLEEARPGAPVRRRLVRAVRGLFVASDPSRPVE